MPFKSKKQKKLFQAAAHNPEFAKKVGLPQSTAQKFVVDAGKKIRKPRSKKK